MNEIKIITDETGELIVYQQPEHLPQPRSRMKQGKVHRPKCLRGEMLFSYLEFE